MPLLGRIRGASRRTLLVVGGGVLVLALGAGLVPLLVQGDAEASACRAAPASARALARDPQRAAAALDPGADARTTGPLERLLRTKGAPLCGSAAGTALAGRAVVAATTGRTWEQRDAPARAHTEREARIAHALIELLGHGRTYEPDFPVALSPYVARTLAAYIEDTGGLAHVPDSDWYRPTVRDDQAEYEDHSGNWATPYPHGRDMHAVFPDTLRMEKVVRRLAASPRAFATLYDAERARFAYYLERLTGDAQEPGEKAKNGLMSTEIELERSANFIATLMVGRNVGLKEGWISSRAAFERAVLRHTRGTYAAAGHQVRTRPASATLADRRPDASAGSGKRAAARLMDGRVQLFATFDRWARERHIPEGSAERLRVEIDSRYVLALTQF
ncbi:hypothetical protein [Streptomyces sp. NBC_01187]|uniref:hypothetical protein n=1 Tax=Streptomyces sp. NBC_01187 TaxID=2903766 RepID=UPI003866A0FC|nr:hypothetical protein OG220_23855 [Streptomyces sp. NBC_01187]